MTYQGANVLVDLGLGEAGATGEVLGPQAEGVKPSRGGCWELLLRAPGLGENGDMEKFPEGDGWEVLAGCQETG